MPENFTIELKGLRFFAAHGMYQEELKVGNEFEVDISVVCKAPKKLITALDQTINYVEIFHIVQQEFNERKQLLETCAMLIADKIQKQFARIEKLTISIKKINPPITNFTGSVAITYTKSFK